MLWCFSHELYQKNIYAAYIFTTSIFLEVKSYRHFTFGTWMNKNTLTTKYCIDIHQENERGRHKTCCKV